MVLKMKCEYCGNILDLRQGKCKNCGAPCPVYHADEQSQVGSHDISQKQCLEETEKSNSWGCSSIITIMTIGIIIIVIIIFEIRMS